MSFPISLTVNGVRRDIDLQDPRVTLLDLMRAWKPDVTPKWITPEAT